MADGKKIIKFDGNRFKTGYIDESGDSGKGSKCLVLTYICLDESKKANKIIRKAKELLRRSKNGQRWLNRLGGEVKFYGFPDNKILLKTLEELAKLNFPIQYVTIYKDGSKINPALKIQILYELIGPIFDYNKEMPHKIIADKDYFDNKKVAYLVVQDYEETNFGGVKGHTCKIYAADESIIKDSDKINMLISIRHENSKNNIGLQIADLISGAIFQEMEKNDKEYLDPLRKHNKNLHGRTIKLKE